MKKIHLAIIIGICGIVLFAGIIIALCPGAGQPGTNAARPVLRVVLYPYFEDVNGDAHASIISLLKE